ncbi:Pentatricopeptide repeat-containing protein [Thalictrum thalictroides]|uniref:Pentatricopeptide repeat-containing protein n=1 Tax=Thalictrum thalictroides TaxID=46969 RepID=A0A7J6WPW3_THATH|nr:Pentatricopeptide repeat-containing protein [Thalictrum thalictroides]
MLIFSSLLFQLSQSHQTLLATKQLHALIIRTHLTYDPFYATRTVRFYALNHDLHSARKVFDETPNRSVYLWNSMIRAYAQDHLFENAFSLFEQMLSSELSPDNYTFACISRACMENFDGFGLRVTHGRAVVMGLGLDFVTSSSLVTAYSKLGILDEACKVFNGVDDPDLVMWNSMISGFGNAGFWEKGLEFFCRMRKMGRNPDGYTVVGLVSGFADDCLLRIGEGIHGFCLKCGFDYSPHVRSSLVSMYSRCHCLHSAYRVFSNLSRPDLVQWTALITGFSQSGECEEALLLFKEMNMTGEMADNVLLASVLAMGARLAILRPGREMHAYILRCGFESDVMVTSALVDMYFKCGFSDFGIRVFETMTRRSVIGYNSVILGFGSHGLLSHALKMFEEMLEKSFKPDHSTFSALLCACSHAGSVKDGRAIFQRMEDEFGIAARVEHYVHMVKLLGMAGELESAYDLIKTMSVPVNSGVLGALLSCCVIHGNSELGETVAHQLSVIEPEKAAYKVMLSNIYASNGKWDDVKILRDNMIGEGLQKKPGISWI